VQPPPPKRFQPRAPIDDNVDYGDYEDMYYRLGRSTTSS
jgi:hypothetical protein